MESLKNFFKRRSWPSKSSQPKFHQDSQGKGSEFISHGLGLGSVDYKCPASPASQFGPYGTDVYETTTINEGAHSPLYQLETTECKHDKMSAQIQDKLIGWKTSSHSCTSTPLSAPQSAPTNLNLFCGSPALEEANPFSNSRDMTPALTPALTPAPSTRSSYNWRKPPDSPAGESVCANPPSASRTITPAHSTRWTFSPDPPDAVVEIGSNCEGDGVPVLHKIKQIEDIQQVHECRRHSCHTVASPIIEDTFGAGVFGFTSKNSLASTCSALSPDHPDYDSLSSPRYISPQNDTFHSRLHSSTSSSTSPRIPVHATRNTSQTCNVPSLHHSSLWSSSRPASMQEGICGTRSLVTPRSSASTPIIHETTQEMPTRPVGEQQNWYC